MTQTTVSKKPASPDYLELARYLRKRFELTPKQAAELSLWLELDYDIEATAELRDAFFKAVMRAPVGVTDSEVDALSQPVPDQASTRLH